MSDIYVTIGHPRGKIPFQNKVAICAGEDVVKAAKQFRKEIAEQGLRGITEGVIRFAPSELFWAIFEDITDEEPTLFSENFFSGIFAPKEEPRVANSWYDTGYADAKAGDRIPPKNDLCREFYDKGWRDYLKSIRNLAMAKLADDE